MSRWRWPAPALAAGGAFLVLAVVVAVGWLDAVDRYAVRELMPGGLPIESSIPVIGRLLQYHGHHFDLSQVVRVPGTIVASVVLAFLAGLVLLRRGERRACVAWALAFAAANAVVVVGQTVITKPALYGIAYGRHERLDGFLSSFPSGHATRLVLLGAVFTYLWPRAGALLAVWVAGALVSLEVDGLHTPSDIAGGVLLAVAVLLSMPVVGVLDRGRQSTRRRARPGGSTDTTSLSST